MKSNWIVVGAVAAMLAASTGLRAQDNTTGSTSTSTTTTPSGSTTSTTDTTTMGTGMTTGTGMNSGMSDGSMSNGSMSGGMMSGGMMDYTMLNNKTFDYVDLKSAKARGLKEDEVATVAKIADKTGMPFHEIADAVLRGETFSKLADMYNLKLKDVLDVNDEKMKVASYMMTYESTGWKNVGMMGSMGSGMSGGMMDTGGMNSGAGMSGGTGMGTGTGTGMGTGTGSDMGTGMGTGTTNSTTTTPGQ